MQMALTKHANNNYSLDNSNYRAKALRKLGDINTISPTFQGGGLKNCNEFLLPEIQKGVIQKELRKLRKDNFEKEMQYKK